MNCMGDALSAGKAPTDALALLVEDELAAVALRQYDKVYGVTSTIVFRGDAKVTAAILAGFGETAILAGFGEASSNMIPRVRRFLSGKHSKSGIDGAASRRLCSSRPWRLDFQDGISDSAKRRGLQLLSLC